MPADQQIFFLAALYPPHPKRVPEAARILAQEIWEFRRERRVSITLNVAAALLIYQGTAFKPIAGVSRASGSDRSLHPDRTAFTEAITEAINERWGPFESFDKTALPTIEGSLSIEQIQENAALLNAIKQLQVHMYTERAPCDYRKKIQEVDKGCEDYFNKLRQLIGDENVYIYHSFPRFALEAVARIEISRYTDEKIAQLWQERNSIIHSQKYSSETIQNKNLKIEELLSQLKKQRRYYSIIEKE